MRHDDNASHECSCRVNSDPIEKLCRYCRVIREQNDADRAELERELYSGEG